MNQPARVDAEYRSLTPLQTRILTHRRYTEGPEDVDGDVLRLLALDPAEALLDVGSGTGDFLRLLREGRGHTGRLCALDASAAAVQGASGVPGVDARLGDAQHLPYPDAEFHAVTARHMLYHLPDPVRAIREARRVLRPGGRFAGVVNIPDTLPGICGLTEEVLGRYGFGDFPLSGSSVHAGNLPGMVEEVFGEAEVTVVEAALVFPEPEPIIAYCLSSLTLHGVGVNDPRRIEIEKELAEAVRARFAELGGVWRDPKGYAICLGRA